MLYSFSGFVVSNNKIMQETPSLNKQDMSIMLRTLQFSETYVDLKDRYPTNVFPQFPQGKEWLNSSFWF